ncbi:glycosyl hydrolase family 28-related protein, partial [Burkholderia gladioli]
MPVLISDGGASAGAHSIYLKGGTTLWDFHTFSSSGDLSLDRWVSGAFADRPIYVSNATGLVTFADGISSNSSSNAITGGSINNASIGATTPSTGAFTTLSASTSNPSLNYLATGTGAVARSYASKFGDVVSAVDFGADPTGTVSSTAAIQAAINAVTASGGTVFLPIG